MYRQGADTPPFRPVPAAPPPPRMMGGPYSSIRPPLHPHVHPSAQGRVSVMQHYGYSLPGPSPSPAHGPAPAPHHPSPPPLLPPPAPSGLLFAAMRPTVPSMRQQLPFLQRPLPGIHPSTPPSMHSSHALHSSLPRLQPVLPPPPPPPLHANFQASLQSTSPLPIQGPPSLPQVQPLLSFGPPPLPSRQQAPFLPPLPASPPSEYPPPPPPSSPPPRSPETHTVDPFGDSLCPEFPMVAHNQDNLPSSHHLKLAALLPPEPPKPADPEMLKNINVLAAFVVKNGPRFESMARARQAGDPKFAFLFESDGAPEAAVGHEYYKWRKQSIALELGLEAENKKVDLGTWVGRTAHEKDDLCPVSKERLASPATSDMDMEDDFVPSPMEGQLPDTSDVEGHANSSTSVGHKLSPKQEGVPATVITGSMATSQDEAPLSDASPKKAHRAGAPWDDSGEARRPLPVGPFDDTNEWEPPQHGLEMKSEDGNISQGCRMGRPTRWENVQLSSHSVLSAAEKVNKLVETDDGQEDKGNSSMRHGAFSVGLVKTEEEANEEKPEDGTLSAIVSSKPNEEAKSIEKFRRLVQKDLGGIDSEEGQHPQKRRRSHSRSRSRSDSRGRSCGRSRGRNGARSRSRSRSRGKARSRSPSHSSEESRWRRNRSPARRARWSRSRSRSPNWQWDYSRSPQRRGDRDWRDERESFGRGRRMGRGNGPSLCFHYARGRCFRGNACKFLHPERENGQDRGLRVRDVPMDRPERSAGQDLMESSWGEVCDLKSHPVIGNEKDGSTKSTDAIPISDERVQQLVQTDENGKMGHYRVVCAVSPVDVTQVASTEELNMDQENASIHVATEHIEKSAAGQGMEAVTDPSASEKLSLDRNAEPEEESHIAEVLSEGLKRNENVEEDMGSVQNTTTSLSGDMEVKVPNVGGDDGIKVAPTSPLLARAPPPPASPPPPALVSPALPLSATNLALGMLPNQYMLAEQRHPTAFDYQQSSSPFSAGVAQPPNGPRPPAQGVSASSSIGFSVGSFNPAHLASCPPFPISSTSHLSIPSVPRHGTQPFLHNIRPLSQPNHLAPITEQNLAARAHHPLLREQPGFSTDYALSKEDSSRMFVGDNARQYMHSDSSSDGLKHDHFRPSTIISGVSAQSSVPWKENSSAVSSSTEQASYSYTLTTIPPLSNFIKLPTSGSVLPTTADQYDPLSESNLLDPFKDSSSKSPASARLLGATFLENVSPNVDPASHTSELDTGNMNEAAADVGVQENVKPPGEWSPAPLGDAVGVGPDQSHAKSKRSSRGLKLLRSAVADQVKVLLKPSWKEGRLSKEAFKTIAKKAVEKVTGNLPSHHIPKSQEKVDQFMAMSSSKISKLVQGYVEKYSSKPNG